MTSNRRWALAVAVLVPAVSVALLAVTGALAPPDSGLSDQGSVVRWGLPVARALRDLSAAGTVGFLLAAAALLPGSRDRADALSPIQRRAGLVGAHLALLWTVSGSAVLVLTFADVAGLPLFSAGLIVQGVPFFVTEFELGQALGLSVAVSGVTAVIARAATRPGVLGAATVAAVVALAPLAFTGHAAGTSGHGVAVDAQLFHLLGVTVWVGGLAAVAASRRSLGVEFAVVAARYSKLAGWCFVAVTVSGVVGAATRLESWSSLASTYGALLAVKVGALTALGAAGLWQRRHVLTALRKDPDSAWQFARLAAGELIVMGVALGAAVALARTSPVPAGAGVEAAGVAESLLGYPMPPPLTLVTAFTAWRVDTIWLPVAVLAGYWYLRAVATLAARGDRWFWGRTVSFVGGCVVLIVATSGSPGVYGQVLFSMHMIQHMTVAAAVPVFLVLGAPITLALRTLPRRPDRSRGPREWLLVVVHSRLARLFGHPLVAPALFVGSLLLFYYSPAFELSLRSHAGHVLMVAHFLITGYLFANVICGLDPGPAPPPHVFRFLLLLVTFSFHAFFGVSLMAGSQVMAEQWFSSLPRDWGDSLAQEQDRGAALSWALGDYPIAILAAALVWSWIKHEARASRRYDRQADRDGDAELAAYNRSLQQLSRDQPNTARTTASSPAEHLERGGDPSGTA